MKLRKIYPKEWIEYHPYTITDAVDRYYCNIVNKVLKVICKYDVMAGKPAVEDGVY